MYPIVNNPTNGVPPAANLMAPLPALPPMTPLQTPSPDSFERIAVARISPNGKISSAFMAGVSASGQIMENTLSGMQFIGQLDAQGNYRLTNGMTGNVFQDDRVVINGYQEEQSPFAIALKAAQKQRAYKASEIPLLRQTLTKQGLNGLGMTIGILDPQNKNKQTGKWIDSNHTKLVTQAIQDPIWGITPNALVKDLGEPWEIKSELASDNVQSYVSNITGDYTRLYTQMSGQLQKLLLNRDPSLRVLNITAGSSRTETYQHIWEQLQTRDENGYYKFPAIRSAVFGPALYGSAKQQYKATVDSVDAVLDYSPVVKQAYQRYVDTTHLASLSGLIIVVAAGNENHGQPFDVPIRPCSGMDEYTKSPYVISVAAADTNQMPGSRAGYIIAPFSSRGDGLQWNPTVTAPGAEIGISFPAGKLGHNKVVAGTSFSTPFTCGVIAMMLQRNPYLTFMQVKNKLQYTATQLSGYSPADQGAGVINPELAILS